MKWLLIGSIVAFAIGYAWMQTADFTLDANIGLTIMVVGFISTVITATLLLY